MDAEKFDRLTQALGAGLSRRGALRAALGTAVLGSLGLNQPDEASAKKKNKNKNKRKQCQNKLRSNQIDCQTCNNKGKAINKANGTACTPPGGVAGSGQCVSNPPGAASLCIAKSNPTTAAPSPTCVTSNNPCVQGGTGTAACCAGTVCGRAFGATAGTFRCCNGPGSQCSAATAADCCSEGCNTNTNPATCACKTNGTACDDNSQCCSNRCVTSGTSKVCAA
jgi:hypothetical protein